MAGAHTEAVRNKLSKHELVQLAFSTETKMGSQISSIANIIKDLLAHFSRLKVDVAITQRFNEILEDPVVNNERQHWTNDQNSRR